MELERSYTPKELSELKQLKTDIAALTKGRFPKALAWLGLSKDAQDVHLYQEHIARNGIFTKFESLVEEWIETKPLLTDQLCSVCDKFDWYIHPDADDLRINASHEAQYKTSAPQTVMTGPDGEMITLNPVWLAETLPSGSLFQLLTRPKCRICMLILHLLSPLPIKSFLAWALEQPLPILHGYQYTMQYQLGQEILVRMKLPQSHIWQDAGILEMKSEEKDASGEQSMVWEAGKLSRMRFLNSSWVRTNEIDYDLVKYWLRRCNEYHEQCHIHRRQGPGNTPIRIIDVVDHCVVHGTLANRYFALSYVWGGIERLRATKDNIKALEQKNSLRIRSASIPRTVQDAMTFVAKVGLRYLWVDSLCIIQDDKAEKHDQISMMHEIYSAAYATIVQHSGTDANAGLPGVRPGSRSLIATKTHVGKTIMMAKAVYSTPAVLSSSIHSTRGWTLQEMLLSHRCLHFFNKQLTFVCGEELAQDWNHRESDATSAQLIPNQLTRVSARMLWQMNPLSLTKLPITVDDLRWDERTLDWLRYFDIYGRILTNYTSRNLTYESDTLHAFQGLGNAISRLNDARFHFGIPSNAFDIALLWINLGPGQRRENMEQHLAPTWSWAAWTGQSTYNLSNLTGDPTGPFIVNSYVRRFYVVENGQSVEVRRARLRVPELSPRVGRCTPYFEAREAVTEPPVDLKKTTSWPDGCLHFWAEECTMDQLYLSSQSKQGQYLHVRNSKKRGGIITFCSNQVDLEAIASLTDNEYSLILMSETPQLLSRWNFGARGETTKTKRIGIYIFDYNTWFNDGTSNRDLWMFNVLLIKRKGAFVERVGFGQVHMLAWLDLNRRRRYMRVV